jgi:hypothetical protein
VPKLGIFVWGGKGNQFTFRKETKRPLRPKPSQYGEVLGR